ncbi:hypothetical protein [Rheinheimera aquimaris]|jgi:hypothetical protein|uniref:hypothetical protein n=1 Tax=Rheinheimera aquimaris TaxID=412437 RepID=UPI000E95142C|nr:hypothetical protein [Rheinheimera aquimaris]MCD1599703.1 hypothetical protein [Rheinheimera aquimaris]HBN90412.1 hypothetical protein [Rheinheimera sp.]|tara:strand:- start:7078 stop:7569 length:492 start_codon:yes stop_codon:yes gene_type:complete
MNRRQFLFSGLALGASGSLLLAGWQFSLNPDEDNRDWVLSAILPALLYGALPEDATLAQAALQRSKTAVNDFIGFLPLSQQQQLHQLFNLLANRLSQLALTGHLAALPALNMTQRLSLLNSWRDSYLLILQQAYHSLRELLYAAFYGQPQHWQQLNYTAPEFR